MDYFAVGEPASFGEIPDGDCLFYELGDRLVFSIKVSDGGKSGMFVFTPGNDGRAPWVGGLPPGTVLHMPGVRVRPNPTSLQLLQPLRDYGFITCVGDQQYIKAAHHAGQSCTANLRTGLFESVQAETRPVLSYGSWKAEVLVDDEWVEIFAFPSGIAPDAASFVGGGRAR